jgi:uncharacterized protein YdgA (DUF945 family)
VKKGLLAILVVIAVIVFVSPGLIGRIAEESLDDSFQRAAQENDDIIVTSESFDRGWFTSEGRHRIEIRDPAARQAIHALIGVDASDGLPTMIVDTRLDHGLIPVTSVSREGGSLTPGLASAVSTMHIEFPDGETFPIPGTIYSGIGLGGSTDSTWVFDPGSHANEAGSAEWGNGEVNFEADASGQNAEFDGAIDSFLITVEDDSMSVGRMTFAGRNEPSPFDMAIGDFSLDIESIEVTTSGEPATSLGPIALSATSEVDGNRVNGEMEMSIIGLEVPGYGRSAFDMAIRFDGFEGESLARIVEILEAADDSVTSGQVNALLVPDIERLAAAGFDLHIDKLDFDLPQGPVSARMRFTVPESDTATFDWSSLLLGLDSDADLVVAEGFVDYAMAINPDAGAIVGMGFLRKNGDVYEMRAEYAKGLLTINGAPMPIPLGQ